MLFLNLNKVFVVRPVNGYLRDGFFLIGTNYYTLKSTRLVRVNADTVLIGDTNIAPTVIHYAEMYYRYFNERIYNVNHYGTSKQHAHYTREFNIHNTYFLQDDYDFSNLRVV